MSGLKNIWTQYWHFPPTDPQYASKEYQQAGKERDLPQGLATQEIVALEKFRRQAHELDGKWWLWRWQIGWTFIVSIIPWIGNLIDGAINYNLVVQTSYQIEIPQTVLRQMYINNIVSLVLSLIPFLGIGLMAHWKANYRNAHILEDYLRSKSGGGSWQNVVQGAAYV